MGYLIEVKTADESGAGTDSNLSINLYGEAGQTTDWIRMNKLISGDAFERDSRDGFIIVQDIGLIHKLELRSDQAYAGADWRVDHIRVQRLPDPRRPTPEGFTRQDVKFRVDKWITTTDKLEVPAPGYELRKAGTRNFTVQVDMAQICVNKTSVPDKEVTETIITDTAVLESAVHQLNSDSTRTSAGISVSQTAGASAPVEGVEVKAEATRSLTAEMEKKAAEELTRTHGESFSRSFQETTVSTEEVPPWSTVLRLYSQSYTVGLTTYTDGFGSQEFTTVAAKEGVSAQGHWEFSKERQNTMSAAELQTFKEVLQRHTSADSTQWQMFRNFEAEAKKNGWIEGLS